MEREGNVILTILAKLLIAVIAGFLLLEPLIPVQVGLNKLFKGNAYDKQISQTLYIFLVFAASFFIVFFFLDFNITL